MACVATWTFSLQAVQIAADELTGGASCIDALEKGINGRMPGWQTDLVMVVWPARLQVK